MDHRTYISALSIYLTKLYGTHASTIILLRILYIEKTIKYRGLTGMGTNDFFFVLYYFFSYIVGYFKANLICMQPMEVMELVLFIIYSYYGPSSSYCSSIFFTRKQTKKHILPIICKTNITEKLLNLCTNKNLYDIELKYFLDCNEIY